jgi:hypothetical protein
MVGREELTDHAWAMTEPLLPRKGRRGGQWQDHRRVINGILMEAAQGSALSQSARALRRVANLRGSALSLATGWDMGSPPDPRADQIGCGGGGSLGGEHRQLDSARNARLDQDVHSSSTRRSMRGAT